MELSGNVLLQTLGAVLSDLQFHLHVLPDLIPPDETTLNNALSPQRGNISPFTGIEAPPPSSTCIRSHTSSFVTVFQPQCDCTVHIKALQKDMADLRPIVQRIVSEIRCTDREAAGAGKLSNFVEGDFVLVAP